MARMLFVLAVLLLPIPAAVEAAPVKCRNNHCESYFYFETLKTRERKTLRFNIRDDQIDSSSVCTEHPYGSVVRRECRSAALVLFKEQCAREREQRGSSKPYCGAASRFSPIQ